MTQDQQNQTNAAIDQSLSRAEAMLRPMLAQPVTSQQRLSIDQIQSFIAQAREARKTDSAAALSLAQRAEILARDLTAKSR